jgi:hypothetical protein
MKGTVYKIDDIDSIPRKIKTWKVELNADDSGNYKWLSVIEGEDAMPFKTGDKLYFGDEELEVNNLNIEITGRSFGIYEFRILQ